MFDYIFCDEGCFWLRWEKYNTHSLNQHQKNVSPVYCNKHHTTIFLRDNFPLRCEECKLKKQQEAKEKAENYFKKYKPKTEIDKIKQKRIDKQYKKRQKRQKKGGSQWL